MWVFGGLLERMTDHNPPPSLDDLSARLRQARSGSDTESDEGRRGALGPARPSGLGIGMRISIELVTTVAVGCGIGYGLDSWLGTMPIFMVVFLLLGGAAAVMNVYRVVKGLDDAVGLGRAVEQRQSKSEGKTNGGQSG